jgi:hypothetical protein
VTVAAQRLDAPGRMCPVDYVYPPSVFSRAPEIVANMLYVVGGLYGNFAALDTIMRLADAEGAATTVVFNGDFHWFDAEPDWFDSIERGVAGHPALRGNIETEIARPDDVGAGCGCAYPPDVSDDTVRRSNDIQNALRDAAATLRTQLGRLPMHLVAQVGTLRIGIAHGDAASLAGWRFAHDALDMPKARNWLADVRGASNIDLFASTHTCLAALRDFDLPTGRLTVINNGSAGMANFAGTTFGVLTRIANTPSPHRPIYGLVRDGIHIDAIPVAFDLPAFLRRFLARWPEGSPAYASYFRRIVGGPEYGIATAAG